MDHNIYIPKRQAKASKRGIIYAKALNNIISSITCRKSLQKFRILTFSIHKFFKFSRVFLTSKEHKNEQQQTNVINCTCVEMEEGRKVIHTETLHLIDFIMKV